MRLLALLVTSVLAAGVGCSNAADEDSADVDSDLTGTGTCRVMHEDSEVVVLRTVDGKMMYAGKQLHVTDVRVTPANAAPQWANTRFSSGHIEYTVAAKPRPDALRRLGQLVGPGTPQALVTLDPKTASVSTAILPQSMTATAGVNGAANVELHDAPSVGPSPFMDAALRKQLVTGAKANATITCGTNQIPLAINTTSVVFDTTVAKVLEPEMDLAAIDAIIAAASSIRGDAYKDPLTKVSADCNTKAIAFADIVDREIKPILQSYMTRTELKTRLRTAYAAYGELGTTVRAATQDAALVTQLLPSAEAMKTNVERALADNGEGWVTKNLQ